MYVVRLNWSRRLIFAEAFLLCLSQYNFREQTHCHVQLNGRLMAYAQQAHQKQWAPTSILHFIAMNFLDFLLTYRSCIRKLMWGWLGFDWLLSIGVCGSLFAFTVYNMLRFKRMIIANQRTADKDPVRKPARSYHRWKMRSNAFSCSKLRTTER